MHFWLVDAQGSADVAIVGTVLKFEPLVGSTKNVAFGSVFSVLLQFGAQQVGMAMLEVSMRIPLVLNSQKNVDIN